MQSSFISPFVVQFNGIVRRMILNTNTLNQPEPCVKTHQTGQSITHKGKRNTGVRKKSCRHSDIEIALKADPCGHSRHNDHVVQSGAPVCDQIKADGQD